MCSIDGVIVDAFSFCTFNARADACKVCQKRIEAFEGVPKKTMEKPRKHLTRAQYCEARFGPINKGRC